MGEIQLLEQLFSTFVATSGHRESGMDIPLERKQPVEKGAIALEPLA